MVIIEHDMDLLFDVTEMITVLDCGKVLADGSSNPVVETAYPLAQKLCPIKFCLRPCILKTQMALFLLIFHTTCATAYLGGIEINICT